MLEDERLVENVVCLDEILVSEVFMVSLESCLLLIDESKDESFCLEVIFRLQPVVDNANKTSELKIVFLFFIKINLSYILLFYISRDHTKKPALEASF